jgi:hypothetical protein
MDREFSCVVRCGHGTHLSGMSCTKPFVWPPTLRVSVNYVSFLKTNTVL